MNAWRARAAGIDPAPKLSSSSRADLIFAIVFVALAAVFCWAVLR